MTVARPTSTALRRRMEAASHGERAWQTNETVTSNFVWNQVYDNGTPVPPGTDSAETVPEGMATVLLSP